MTDAYVSIEGVTRQFGNVLALRQASIDVQQGEIVGLLGPSGCGKTTLLRLVGGLDEPNEGRITIDGTVLNGPGTFVPPERRQIGMVFQDYALFPHLDVGKNVSFGLTRDERKRGRMEAMLELVGLPGLQHRMPHELSGGQQQRVALARTLAAGPRLILMDEPFSNLDPSIRARVRDEVRTLITDIGITAIFVTHDQDEALSVADRVAVMSAGQVLQVGTPQQIYESPATREVAEFVGQPNFLPGEAAGRQVTCELGTLPLRTAATGPVDVLIRSEQVIRVAQGGCAAIVRNVAYYGHEEIVTLELATGTPVRARWRSSDHVQRGETVAIAVCDEVQAFGRQ